MQNKLSWKPVLRGNIYCSPACGASCTKAAHDEAVKKAKALAKRMGKGWKIRVHENLGWFYAVVKGEPMIYSAGFLEIIPPHRPGDTYTAWVQSSPQFIVHDKDPKIALRKAVEAFDAHLSNLNRLRKLVTETLAK